MNFQKILHFSFGPVIAAGLGIIILPFITWFFSVEDVGRLTIYHVVVGASVSIFSLAMHQAYVREYYEVKDRFQLLKLSLVPGSILLTMILVVVFFTSQSLSFIFFKVESTLISLALIEKWS